MSFDALARWDAQMYRSIHEQFRREWLDPVFVLITDTGLGQVQLAVLLAFMAWRKARGAAIAALAAGAFTGLIRLGIMQYVGRMRPSNFDFARPMEGIFGRSSFPSGHSTTSFAIAFLLALLFKGTDRAWIGWLASFWAVLVGFSRVYVGVHYPMDIVGAAGLALVGASAVYLFWLRQGWWTCEDPDTDPSLDTSRTSDA